MRGIASVYLSVFWRGNHPTFVYFSDILIHWVDIPTELYAKKDNIVNIVLKTKRPTFQDWLGISVISSLLGVFVVTILLFLFVLTKAIPISSVLDYYLLYFMLSIAYNITASTPDIYETIYIRLYLLLRLDIWYKGGSGLDAPDRFLFAISRSIQYFLVICPTIIIYKLFTKNLLDNDIVGCCSLGFCILYQIILFISSNFYVAFTKRDNNLLDVYSFEYTSNEDINKIRNTNA